jgi:hypothetical protein
MKQTITIKNREGRKIIESRPLTKSSKGYSENILTPVNLTGVVIPWLTAPRGRRESEFKLVCSSGLEYFFVADPEWKDVLSQYRWEEVKVVGLLNIFNMTLIPQKVFPKGPRGDAENVIDLAAWRGRDLIKRNRFLALVTQFLQLQRN